MKIKNIFASVAAVAMSMSVIASLPVSAASTAIDFEDGSFANVSMKTDDGGDFSVLSVVDFNGSKQLKVDVQDCTLIPKVYFDLNAILGADKFESVDKITADITMESKDGSTPPGWIGGAIGTQGPNWSDTAYDGGEYELAVSPVINAEKKFLLPANKLVNGTEQTHMLFMRWATDVPYNMYIDNIKFLDKDGNVIELAGAAAAPAAEVTTTAVAETAPAADSATSSAKTGNTAAAAFGAAMAVAGAAVVVSKKRK